MRRMTRLVTLVCCSIVMLTVCFPSPGRTSEPAITNRTIEELKLTNVSTLEALRTLAFYHQVPVGIELPINDQNSEIKLSINIRQTRLKDVLDLIVQQDTRYRWEVNDEVINFVPVHSRNRLLEKLLNTNVRSFSPRKGAYKNELKDAMTNSPEVQSLLKENKVLPLNMSVTVHRARLPQELDLRMSNTSVRRILNMIARESNFKLWIVDQISDKGDVLFIEF